VPFAPPRSLLVISLSVWLLPLLLFSACRRVQYAEQMPLTPFHSGSLGTRFSKRDDVGDSRVLAAKPQLDRLR